MLKEVHLELVLRVFSFLLQNYYSRMGFDPNYPFIVMNEFKQCKWKDSYGDLNEAIPPNAPE